MRKTLTQSQIDDEAIRRGIKATVAMLGINVSKMASMMQISPRTLYNRIDNPGEMTLHELRRAEIIMRSAGVDWRALRDSIH